MSLATVPAAVPFVYIAHIVYVIYIQNVNNIYMYNISIMVLNKNPENHFMTSSDYKDYYNIYTIWQLQYFLHLLFNTATFLI